MFAGYKIRVVGEIRTRNRDSYIRNTECELHKSRTHLRTPEALNQDASRANHQRFRQPEVNDAGEKKYE